MRNPVIIMGILDYLQEREWDETYRKATCISLRLFFKIVYI